MNRILKAKSWQIFGILIIPIIFYVILPLDSLETLSPYILTLFYWILFGWPLVVGFKLNRKLPIELRRSDILFLLSGFFIISLSTISSFLDFSYRTQNNSPGINEVLILLSLLSVLYILYFSSKSLRKLEKKRNVTFEEYQFIIVLFFINIVGVWFLQPRIKKVIENPGYKESGVI